jgi:hypothetical protein
VDSGGQKDKDACEALGLRNQVLKNTSGTAGLVEGDWGKQVFYFSYDKFEEFVRLSGIYIK